MGLTRVSIPQPVVTPSGVKQSLRILDDRDDALIETLIVGAEDWIERETRTQLGAAEYLLTLDEWPQCRELKLPRPPLIDVQSIEFTDAQGSEGPLPSGLYMVDLTSRPGRIAFTGSLPQVADVPGAIRIRFIAGHEDAADVPPTLVQAVKMLVGHWHANAEATSTLTIKDVPMAVQSIVMQHLMPEVV